MLSSTDYITTAYAYIANPMATKFGMETENEETKGEQILSLRLTDAPDVPVHLALEDGEEFTLRLDTLYTVSFGDRDPSLNSIPILEIDVFGTLGKSKTEVPILEQQRPQFFSDHVKIGERTQQLIKERVYDHGKFEVKKEGEWTVST